MRARVVHESTSRYLQMALYEASNVASDTYGQSVSHFVYHVAHCISLHFDGPVNGHGGFWYGRSNTFFCLSLKLF